MLAELVLLPREMDPDDGRPKYTDISTEGPARRLRALDSLKAALTTAPVLAAPDFSKPWIILTDCSDYAMGACLAQLDENGIERPVAYASANLSEAHKNYGITDKVRVSLGSFHFYLCLIIFRVGIRALFIYLIIYLI